MRPDVRRGAVARHYTDCATLMPDPSEALPPALEYGSSCTATRRGLLQGALHDVKKRTRCNNCERARSVSLAQPMYTPTR